MSATGMGILLGAYFYFVLAMSLYMTVALWLVYAKAEEPGWAIFIPIYNLWVLHRIAGKPGWWIVLYLVPFVSLVITLLVMLGLAEGFGRGAGFGIGLAIVPVIFLPILAFNDVEYEGF